MIDHLYQNIILKNPRSILVILLITLISFGYYSKDFRLDASSETLLIENLFENSNFQRTWIFEEISVIN